MPTFNRPTALSLVSFATVLTALSLSPRAAFADDKTDCLTAADKGQRARKDRLFTEARTQFLTCARPICPQIVRQDCMTWQGELTKILPSITLAIRDAEDHDVIEAKIFLDAKPFADKVDGKAVFLDPGEHVFRIEAEGFEPSEIRVIAREGEQNRAVDIKIQKKSVTPPPPDVKPDPPVAPTTGGGHTVGPWIVVGVGAAGVVAGSVMYVLGSSSFPSECDASTKLCAQGTPTDVVEKAQSADGLQKNGMVVAIGGGVVVVGGLLWHFLEPTAPSKSIAKNVSPFFGASGGGLAWSGNF